jgi:hypothetical protein
VIVFLVALPLAAQNLLTNPDFDTNLEGWKTLATWSSEDWQGSPTSGSAIEVNSHPSTWGMEIVSQCVEIPSPAEQYRLNGWILNPSGQSGSGYGKLYLALFSAPACDDEHFMGGFDTAAVGQTGVWEAVDVTVDMQPGVVSLKVGTVLQKIDEPGAVQVYVDHVILEVIGEIFADGFESGNATAWSFASEICDNGIDDDGDGFADCDDFDCIGVNPCGPENCDNGRDDDGDSFVDCDDFDCIGVNPCGPEICDNGTDDDGDGFVDCDDFDCDGSPPCP